jgi:hypothetical protein
MLKQIVTQNIQFHLCYFLKRNIHENPFIQNFQTRFKKYNHFENNN